MSNSNGQRPEEKEKKKESAKKKKRRKKKKKRKLKFDGWSPRRARHGYTTIDKGFFNQSSAEGVPHP